MNGYQISDLALGILCGLILLLLLIVDEVMARRAARARKPRDITRPNREQ